MSELVDPNGAPLRGIGRKCPRCGAKIEGDSVGLGPHRKDAVPAPGDVAISSCCGLLEIVTDSEQKRPMTHLEWRALPRPRRRELLHLEAMRRDAFGP